jgi:hypothetical protein
VTALLLVGYVAHIPGVVGGLTADVVTYVVMALPHIDLADTVSWGALLGVFTPLLTAIVQRPTWSAPKRTIIAVGISILLGLLTCLADGTIGKGATVVATVAAVVMASAAAYKTLWKPVGVAGSIELATTPAPRHAAPIDPS